MDYQLSEDNIKHCTLGFLKSYYKNNSSRGFGHTEARLDMISEDGIIADGFLKFYIKEDDTELKEEDLLEEEGASHKKQGIPFTATFEATSQETAEEIQYKVQNTLLILDAFTVACMVAAGSYGYNYLNDQYTLNELGALKFWGGFFSVLMTTLLGYVLVCRYSNFPRYRYIFALAQFDSYRVDEQWVSYGEDVFENSTNKYLVELKKQCAKKGIGLIMVNHQLQPSLIMTPAREPAGKKGRIKQFFDSSTSFTRQRFGWLRLPSFIRKRMPSVSKPKSISQINTGDYLRFSKSYWKQGLLILFSALVLGEIYIEELKNPNIVYIEEGEYEKKILEQTKNNKPEPSVTFIDLETGNRKKVIDPRAYEALPNNANKIDKKIAPKPTPLRNLSATEAYQKALIVAISDNTFETYSCKRLTRIKGEAYLIQVGTANDYAMAMQKVKASNAKGIKVNAMNMICFSQKNREYVIYLDDIYTSKEEAKARASEYHKLRLAKGFKSEQTKIRILRSQTNRTN